MIVRAVKINQLVAQLFQNCQCGERTVNELPIRAARGSAGSLIPPVEYHVLSNPTDRVAITLHIYGGEIDRCNVFVPREDGWRERQIRVLGYDD